MTNRQLVLALVASSLITACGSKNNKQSSAAAAAPKATTASSKTAQSTKQTETKTQTQNQTTDSSSKESASSTEDLQSSENIQENGSGQSESVVVGGGNTETNTNNGSNTSQEIDKGSLLPALGRAKDFVIATVEEKILPIFKPTQQPVSKEETVAVKEEKPAIKEEKVSTKEETVAVKEEKPATKEETVAVKEEKPATKEEKVSAQEEARLQAEVDFYNQEAARKTEEMKKLREAGIESMRNLKKIQDEYRAKKETVAVKEEKPATKEEKVSTKEETVAVKEEKPATKEEKVASGSSLKDLFESASEKMKQAKEELALKSYRAKLMNDIEQDRQTLESVSGLTIGNNESNSYGLVAANVTDKKVEDTLSALEEFISELEYALESVTSSHESVLTKEQSELVAGTLASAKILRRELTERSSNEGFKDNLSVEDKIYYEISSRVQNLLSNDRNMTYLVSRREYKNAYKKRNPYTIGTDETLVGELMRTPVVLVKSIPGKHSLAVSLAAYKSEIQSLLADYGHKAEMFKKVSVSELQARLIAVDAELSKF